jgi:hypothetical protein
MKEEFVKYEQGLALKELGFDDMCFCYFDNEKGLRTCIGLNNWNSHEGFPLFVSSPLKQQVFRWFREEYKCCSILFCDNGDIDYSNHKFYYEIRYMIYSFDSYYEEPNFVIGNYKYNTYEEAESACIDKLIELAKKQKL